MKRPAALAQLARKNKSGLIAEDKDQIRFYFLLGLINIVIKLTSITLLYCNPKYFRITIQVNI
jgi:hypothetical protein